MSATTLKRPGTVGCFGIRYEREAAREREVARPGGWGDVAGRSGGQHYRRASLDRCGALGAPVASWLFSDCLLVPDASFVQGPWGVHT